MPARRRPSSGASTSGPRSRKTSEDHLALDERGDLGLAQAEDLAEDVAVVLAQAWGGRVRRLEARLDAPRRADGEAAAAEWRLGLDEEAAGAQVRVVEQLGGRQHRAGRDAGALEQ